MKLVSAKEILNKARCGGYAIGAFNINNLEWTISILKAAQEQNSPVILSTSMGAAKYMGGYKLCYNIVNDLINFLNITIPVSLHLDHGDYNSSIECINSGYTSVMYDGSSLPFEENIKNTKEIVKLAKQKNISVEAEVGGIGGEEDGQISEGELADVDQCIALSKTGIDFLAAGIGNIHGKYPENWKGLDFDLLKEISLNTNIPLVLHGGTGIPSDQIKKSISLGISKINVNTECQIAFSKGIRSYIEQKKDLENKGYDPRKLLKPGYDSIIDVVKEKINWFGSQNKA